MTDITQFHMSLSQVAEKETGKYQLGLICGSIHWHPGNMWKETKVSLFLEEFLI